MQLEAVTPGEYKQRGRGMIIDYAVHDTPFGRAFIAMTPRGICRFSFPDEHAPDDLLAELGQNWPLALMREDGTRTLPVIRTMFGAAPMPDRPISLHVNGTNFQVSVWRALLHIPPARVMSYAQVAGAIGNPKAARGVGHALGSNPVAFLIPCHRVIRQNGRLGGYHWGETRKQALHIWEAARYG